MTETFLLLTLSLLCIGVAGCLNALAIRGINKRLKRLEEQVNRD
jgi:hypothetical protein